ncbi:MAG: hypothetical protein A2007_03680 [Verrucomicrobia bacterium GWC2_42_7]|nr:MAG: hypothetical protein A2007_03680 [Verrucomicrobia bacterium GWC2_42_7]
MGKKEKKGEQVTKVALAPRVSGSKPFWSLLCATFAILMVAALWDYHPGQSSFNTTAVGTVKQVKLNVVGEFGTQFAFRSIRIFGLVAWMFPLYMAWLAYVCLCRLAHILSAWKVSLFVLSLICASSFLTLSQDHLLSSAIARKVSTNYFTSGLGGICGKFFFSHLMENSLGVLGSALVTLLLGTIVTLLAFANYTNPDQALSYLGGKFKSLFLKIQNALENFEKNTRKPQQVTLEVDMGISVREPIKRAAPLEKNEKIEKKISKIKEESVPVQPVEEEIPEAVRLKIEKEEALKYDKPQNQVSIKVVEEEKVEKVENSIPERKGNYIFPTIDLLKEAPAVPAALGENHQETAQALVTKLAEFGVEVTVEEIHTGPVITRYEVTPAKGVRVEKILSLDKNIALGLKAISVRIMAPVPGKGCVGIELPNKTPLPVCLRDIVESAAWAQANAEIPIVLGKEVTGKPLVADLTKMPHLLIAGSTGSGKTVCINAIIASLLYYSSPDDLRFIMVDPKIVEMKVYNDLPHMLIPVVTDPKRVPGALKWLIGEMERRYQIFAQVGARNIASFNAKIIKDFDEKRKGEELDRALSPEERAAVNAVEVPSASLELPKTKLPYIVCIVDELADLMMVAPADIETCIARLAQLARAAGIHLIIATQRPSVNVITGIIKANLPSRIAFKVASKVDSRTILDFGGADQLIGRGDMLFVPPGTSSIVRAQGAFVSDEEINDIVEFLKRNGPPQFAEDVQRQIESDSEEDANYGGLSREGLEDELIPEALEVLRSSQRASTSMLQRRLKIGYNRAARIMEILEKQGYVGPDNGPQPREILKELSF